MMDDADHQQRLERRQQPSRGKRWRSVLRGPVGRATRAGVAGVRAIDRSKGLAVLGQDAALSSRNKCNTC